MNCVLYARVSTDKQADKELSIPAQLQAMRDYARQRNWVVTEEFLEPGASAKTTERPVLRRLLSRIRDSEPSIDVVLVHKIDRLARNVYDHATMKVLFQKHHVRLASVVENVDDTIPGQLVENIMASIAQFYSGNLSEEVKKGMRQKVLRGGWPHLPPRGYILVRGDDGRGARVEKHPKEAPLIQAAFERYATGWHSFKSLAATLRRDGLSARNGRPLSPSQIQIILTNPFYLARIRWKDLNVKGAHEALVSESLFAQVRDVLRRRSRNPGAKGSVAGFPLRGLAICASCRGHMTAGWHKRRFGYYRCARRSYNRALCNARGYCPSRTVDNQIQEICRSLHLSNQAADAILQAAEDQIRRRTAQLRLTLNSLRAQRATLAGRELRLTEAYLAGTVQSEAYKATGTKLRGDLSRIDAALAGATRDPAALLERVTAVIGRARCVWDLHEELNDHRRVELLRSVFQNVVLAEDGIIGFTLQSPFDAIFKAGPHVASSSGNDRDIKEFSEIATEVVSRLSAQPEPDPAPAATPLPEQTELPSAA